MIKFLSAFSICALITLSACATVGSAWNNAPPPDMSAKALMSRGTCTDLPTDKTGTVNATKGWVKLPTATMQCGTKYASGAYRCDNPAACEELVLTTFPGEKDRGKDWPAAVDLVDGTGAGCVQPALRFGVGSLDCQHVPADATGKRGVRAIYSGIVPPLQPGAGDQTATSMILKFRPTGTAPVTIGQMGFLQMAADQ